MSREHAIAYLKAHGKEDRFVGFDASSHTVLEAAALLGCEPREIGKSLAIMTKAGPIMIVVAGDAKLDNRRFKDTFHEKAVMMTPEETVTYTHHQVGGICPFGVPDTLPIYFDESLKRLTLVCPAGGDSQSAVRLSIDELTDLVPQAKWVCVTKGWQVEED